jgi:uncharacterized protein YkwD
MRRSAIVDRRGAVRGLVAALALFAMLSPAAAASRETPDDRAVAEIERTTLEAINAERRANGLPPLALSPELCRLARAFSRDMVERRFFDHVDPDGKHVQERTDRAGIKRWLSVGENIARNRGFKDPVATAVRDWMRSEGHRDNILDEDYTETGVGVWIAPDRTVYFTQIFLRTKR